MPIRLSGINSGLDTDAIVKELVSAYSLKTEKYQKEQTKIEWKQEAWKTLNTKIYGLYTNVSNLRFDSAYNLKKTTVSNASKASVSASTDAITGTQKLKILQTAQASYITGGKLKTTDDKEVTKATKMSDLGITANTSIKITFDDETEKTIELTPDMAIADLAQEFKDAGLNANFDENNQRFFISAKESGSAGNFTLSGDDAGMAALSTLGLTTAEQEIQMLVDAYNAANTRVAELNDKETNGTLSTEETAERAKLQEELNNYSSDISKIANGTKTIKEVLEEIEAQKNVENGKTLESIGVTSSVAVPIEGQNAVIELNGVRYENNSNSFSINGLSIEALATTAANEEILINTTVDTQGIYDKIKDFLTEYNTVINEITKLYNAESASDYQPLTDEEKEAMSEEQVEKWENKIKDALLRRDSSLGTIMTTMINSMSQSIELENGEKLTLSSFGIQTLGFLNAAKDEQYAYHIDGDADDENSSGKTDKLMKAIQENPEQICEFMKKLTSNLYSAIDEKMKSTELSSAYKVYNDKELDSQLTKYKKLISDWEKKVAAEEEYYYKKFSDMEVALSKLQSQTSAISGLLGM